MLGLGGVMKRLFSIGEQISPAAAAAGRNAAARCGERRRGWSWLESLESRQGVRGRDGAWAADTT